MARGETRGPAAHTHARTHAHTDTHRTRTHSLTAGRAPSAYPHRPIPLGPGPSPSQCYARALHIILNGERMGHRPASGTHMAGETTSLLQYRVAEANRIHEEARQRAGRGE